MRETSFCTIVTASHLRYAIALDRAIKRHHPETILTIMLLDPQAIDFSYFDGLTIVTSRDLGIPDFERLTLSYSAFSLACNLKPFLVSYVLGHVSKKAIFLDSDIFVVGRFDDVFDLLDEASLVLTPHVIHLALISRSLVPTRQFAELGVYNGGMWAVQSGPDAFMLLRWLEEFLSTTDLYYAEQKVLSLAAQLARAGFRCLDHPGYNVAYWNFHERPVEKSGNHYVVDGQPVIFFHLSGFDDASPEFISKHWPATRPQPPFCDAMIKDYLDLLPSEPALKGIGYTFDRIGNRPVTPAMRRYYIAQGTFVGFRRYQVKTLIMRAVDAVKRRISGE